MRPLIPALPCSLIFVACAADPPDVSTTHASVGLLPRVLLANQDGFYEPPASCGAVSGQVASISGHWFLQQACNPDLTGDCDVGSPSWITFRDRTQAEVECNLSEFLAANAEEFEAQPRDGGVGCQAWWAPDLTRTIIIDIERPHPADLAELYTPAQRSRIVDAYKLRIAAARSVFPHAKLGLYGTLIPDARGRIPDPTCNGPNPPDTPACKYEARRLALRTAGNQGLYDQLDYLVPVLYPRFGCDQGIVPGVRCIPGDPDDPDEIELPPRPWCDAGYSDIAAYTQQGVDGSRSIDGARDMPLLPLLTVRVHNGNSCFGQEPDRMLLLDMIGDDRFDTSLGLQLRELRARGVTEAVLWMQDTDQEVFREPNTGGWTVTSYTDHLCAP